MAAIPIIREWTWRRFYEGKPDPEKSSFTVSSVQSSSLALSPFLGRHGGRSPGCAEERPNEEKRYADSPNEATVGAA
jgi:hypothetical protein